MTKDLREDIEGIGRKWKRVNIMEWKKERKTSDKERKRIPGVVK